MVETILRFRAGLWERKQEMNKLIQKIEEVRGKLEGLRRHSLNEMSTRTKIINPLLDSLGWDVGDPDEVEEEYTTFDGKSADYALKISGNPVLLVEAKAINDPLNDNKAIGQVVGYAANAGIVWCVLTNGVKWQVYRSVEKCPAPEKLMLEVSLDPKEAEGISVQQLAQQMWRFSREEMAKGTQCILETLGKQTFTDGKVRKALDILMNDPPQKLLKLLQEATGDDNIKNQQVKESLARIWAEKGVTPQRPLGPSLFGGTTIRPVRQKDGRSRKGKKPSREYDEQHHLSGKPKEVEELYRSLDRICFALAPGNVEKTFAKFWVNYNRENAGFCSVLIHKNHLRIFLKLKYSRIENPPSFARDVSHIGHYGTGDLELAITSVSQLKEAEPLIRQSFEGQA